MERGRRRDAIVGATGAPVLALAPASAHVPTWLVYASGAVALIGFYVMLAPLAHWWPWADGIKPLVNVIVAAIVAAIVIVALHGGSTHTASGHASSSRHATKTVHRSHPIETALKNAATYSGKYFTVRIPRGWSSQESEVNRSGEKESTWADLAEPKNTLLIDFSPASNRPLQEDTTDVHDTVLHEGGFRELYYGTGDLSGVESWMWIFRVYESKRIDYFFNRCSTGFAVLGSSTPRSFDKLKPVFRAIAESVRAVCR